MREGGKAEAEPFLDLYPYESGAGVWSSEAGNPASGASACPGTLPVHQPFKMPGWPVRVDGLPTRVTSSPMLGEHTELVVSDCLGLSAQAVAALKAEGAL